MGKSQVQWHDLDWRPGALALLFVFFLFVFQPVAWPQQHDSGDMKDMSGMQLDDHGAAAAAEESPKQIAIRLADKPESEFNHRFAGFLVLLAGVFILARSARGPLIDRRLSTLIDLQLASQIPLVQEQH